MIENELREIIKRYPQVKPQLTGYAAWLVFEDDMKQWLRMALARAHSGEPIVCKFESPYIPDGVADMVMDMLGYADCANCVKTVFSDALAFTAKSFEKERYEKFEPRIGNPPYIYTAGKTELEESDIREAVKTWDTVMPELAGMLDAQIEQEEVEA